MIVPGSAGDGYVRGAGYHWNILGVCDTMSEREPEGACPLQANGECRSQA